MSGFRIKSFLSLVFFAILFSVPASAERLLTSVPLQRVFAPAGFDDNDNVEIVVYGHLPNLCYHSPSASAAVKDTKIIVTAKATYVEQTHCPDVTVPYSLTVTLGQLTADNYEISVVGAATAETNSLLVTTAPAESTDNFYYANVEKLYVSKNNKVVRLAVRGLSTCLNFDRIGTLDNGVDVVSLMPILEYNMDLCEPQDEERILTWDVPDQWHDKTVLLHVRSMNGLSRNVILNSKAPYPLQ